MPSSPVIRQATAHERAAVVATVAAAFNGDPAWTFILGEEDFERLATHFAGSLFDIRIASHNVWVADDLTAVSMWDAPGPSDTAPGLAYGVWARFRAAAGEHVYERLTRYNDALAAVAPHEPYWYLGVLATHPARQRQGLATAVIAPVVAEADKHALPCCLETSTEDNRSFYQRRGFTQATDVVLPGGPATWWLRRAAV
jgi:GNAT superfamily N-acetyltransferase